MTQIWRKKAERGAFFGKTPESRKKQLANLRGHKGKEEVSSSKYMDRNGLKEFMVEQCRTLSGEKSIWLEWYETVTRRLFPDNLADHLDIFICSIHKKSGKTFYASALLLWCSLIKAPRYSDLIIVSNSLQQSSDICLKTVKRIISQNKVLKKWFKVRENDVECLKTGSRIIALPAINPGAVSGRQIFMVVVDESAQHSVEAQRRLLEELQVSPTCPTGFVFHISTCSHIEDNEFNRLFKLAQVNEEKRELDEPYNEALGGLIVQSDDILCPWITEKWLAQKKKYLLPQVFERLYHNTYILNPEERFVTPEQIKAIISGVRGVKRKANVVIAIDASVSGDTTSLVAVEHREDDGIYRLIDHAITVPTKENRIDYQQAVIDKVNDFDVVYNIRAIIADPYQLLAILQGFKSVGYHTVEFTQSIPNLTAMSHFLYTLIESRKIEIYNNLDIIEHLGNCSTKLIGENRYRIIKAGVKRHIDLIICLAMACYTIAQGIEEEGSSDIDVLPGNFEGIYPGGAGREGIEKFPQYMSDPLGVFRR